jgi:GT2 family glycosyltransferase
MIQIVFANYGCHLVVESAIRSLAQCHDIDCVEVVIVENGGERVDTAALQSLGFRSVQSIVTSKNLGYFGALVATWQRSKEKNFQFRILCNPDVEFAQRDLVRRLMLKPILANVAVIAPSIISSRTGRDQNPYMNRSPGVLRRFWWRFLYFSFLVYRLRSRISGRARVEPNTVQVSEQPIFAPHGAMMIFSPSFFELAAFFSLVPFLYAEELFVGRMSRDAGLTVLYAPDLQVVHRENAVTGMLPSRQRFNLQRAAIGAYLKQEKAMTLRST